MSRIEPVSAATWAILAKHLDAQQLLDVIFTVGAYETIAFMFRSLDLELDDDLKTSLAVGVPPMQAPCAQKAD